MRVLCWLFCWFACDQDVSKVEVQFNEIWYRYLTEFINLKSIVQLVLTFRVLCNDQCCIDFCCFF